MSIPIILKEHGLVNVWPYKQRHTKVTMLNPSDNTKFEVTISNSKLALVDRMTYLRKNGHTDPKQMDILWELIENYAEERFNAGCDDGLFNTVPFPPIPYMDDKS